MEVHLKNKFEKELLKLSDGIREQIKLKSDNIFNEWSQTTDTNYYVKQLLNNNFSDLNEARFKQIRNCLKIIH